ncbi:hypothetical protein BH23ACI1_BH23ACI1_29630 [soil metagenome]
MLSRVVIALFLVALALPSAALAQSLKVAPLSRDGQVLVSFSLGQELTDEIREAIHSGLTYSFVYKVDLRRGSSVWFDRTIASAVVTATVRYDNLTRRYQVTRLLDGRTDWADTTDREEIAWGWLTTGFDRLPLFSRTRLQVNAEYYLRVRAHSTPRNALFLMPWQGDDVVGLAKFTFIR